MRNVFLIGLAILLSLSALPTGNAAGYATTYGARVLAASTDFNPLYQATPLVPTICSRDTGVAATATDDLYYVHNINTVSATVGSGDVRLTSQGGFTSGTLVVSETDVSQPFGGLACTAFEANVGYIEADGLPGFTAGDEVVWSADATLGAGDIRLSSATGSGDSITTTAGTYVVGTDTDVVAAGNANGLTPDSTAVVGKGSFVLRFYDANLNGILDSGDTLYLAFSPAASPAPASPTVSDIYLYAGSAFGSFGTKVLRSSTDYLPELDVCGAGPTCFLATTTAVPGTCANLFIHFNDDLGQPGLGVIQMNDIALYVPSTTTCASPQPASTISTGTRVTTTTQLQGTAIVASTALAAQIYFEDANSNTYFDAADPVYIHRTPALGGTGAAPPATGVAAGDFRVTSVTAGASTFSAGTVVASADADSGAAFATIATNVGPGTWFARRLNVDGATENPLTSATLIRYADLTPAGVCGTVAAPCFTAGTDAVYVDTDSSSTVTAGDIRLNAGSTGLGAGPATAVVGGDADAVAVRALVTSSDFRVTGGDATFDNTRGETAYFSRDAFVNGLDYRVVAAAGSSLAAGAVACPADVDCTDQGVHTSDVFYLSRCAVTCNGRIVLNDVQLAPSSGTRIASSAGADFVPTLKPLVTVGGTLLRYNRGDAGAVNDDTFYASTGSTTAITVNAARLTPLGASLAAGTTVATGDTEELSATTAVTADTAGGLAGRIKSCDLDSIPGYTLNDAVYVDNPLGGTTGALSNNDLRITSITISGQSYTAGTIVQLGNLDLQQTTCATWTAGVWTMAYHDDNANSVFDTGDVLYALPPSALSQTQPVLGAVYLSGSGGSTSSGSSGGTTPVTPVTPPTNPPSSSSGTTSSTTSSSTSSAPSTLDDLNQALKASLTVTHGADGSNVVAWAAQPGALGYQVWSHNSPWTLVMTVDGSTTTIVQKASASTHYLVTAFTSEATKLIDINTQPVPGLGVNPDGPAPDGSAGTAGTSTSKGKGAIPAPELVLGLGAVAVALAVARRRLA
jgi:hypothetical protein